MINTESYQALIDALSKLFAGPDSEAKASKEEKQKGKSITIVSIDKADKGEMKIPKAKEGAKSKAE